MNHLLNALRPATTTDTGRADPSTLAYGVCSALMPYLLAALLLVAFG